MDKLFAIEKIRSEKKISITNPLFHTVHSEFNAECLESGIVYYSVGSNEIKKIMVKKTASRSV
jgi:hypothetical protein